MPTNTPREELEKEFDKKLPNKIAEVIDDFGSTVKSDIKSFFQDKLAQERALMSEANALTEQRMREEFVRIVNDESAIDGQYLEPSYTRKQERERITKRLNEMKSEQPK